MSKDLGLVRLLRIRDDASLLGTMYCCNRILGVLEFSRLLPKLLFLKAYKLPQIEESVYLIKNPKIWENFE